MAPRLFGTDGVRGTPARWPLDPATVRRLGASIVRVLDSATAAASAHRTRHARVGCLDRTRAGLWRRVGGRHRRRRRRAAHARRGLPHAHQRFRRWARSSRRRTTRSRTTASRSSPAAVRSSPRSWNDEWSTPSPTTAGRSRRVRPPPVPLRISPIPTAVISARCCPSRGGLGGATWSSTAPTARPPASRRECSPTLASTST